MNPPESSSPADNNEFWGKAHARLKEASALLRQVRRISTGRLIAAGAGLGIALGGGEGGLFSLWWLLLPGAAFIALAVFHERLLRRAQEAHHIAGLHHRAALRVDRDTEGEPDRPRTPAAAIRRAGVPVNRPSLEDGQRLASRLHRVRALGEGQLAEHLDLFGSEQLFERLADWRTDAGGETLAGWLLHPSPPAEVRSRQEAVRELRSRPGIREALAATGCLEQWPSAKSSVFSEWLGSDPAAGAAGEAEGATEAAAGGAPLAKKDSPRPPWPPSPGPRMENFTGIGALTMTVSMLVHLLLLIPAGAGLQMFLITLFAAGGLGLMLRTRVRAHETIGKLMDPEISGLRLIAASLAEEDFASPRLRQLRGRLAESRRALASLQRLQARLRLRRNLLFAPVAALLFWGTHHVWLIERWRRRHGPAMRGWIEAGGEFDALVALAQYAEERPGHVFPEFDDRPGLEAVNLGHPLIPEVRLQRNTVRLGRGEADVLIVTGSNMSGKSTLLRAIGVNFLLARMGAPTATTTFRLGPLALGASIAVHDSLREGISRFLAELLALRSVLDTGSPEEPLLFLLDEVLQGTNSNDRRAATAALLRELGRRSAVGVMTTHDLSLTELAHELPGRVRNMHFTERVVDGAMDFDYQLREGVLPHGNALDLMRILRLPAPESERSEFTSLPARGAGREH